MLVELTDIRIPSQHYSLWDFHLQHIDIQGCISSHIGLELQCIDPYLIGCTCPNHISTNALLQLSDSPLILYLQWIVWLCPFLMEIRLLIILPKLPQGFVLLIHI